MRPVSAIMHDKSEIVVVSDDKNITSVITVLSQLPWLMVVIVIPASVGSQVVEKMNAVSKGEMITDVVTILSK